MKATPFFIRMMSSGELLQVSNELETSDEQPLRKKGSPIPRKLTRLKPK